MTETSARLAMPLLQSGQAQKEIYHNEALALIDLAVAASAVTIGTNAPPVAPAIGQCWIVGSTPARAWLDHAGALAGWTTGGWRFVAPTEGMVVWVESAALWARHAAGVWLLGDVAASSITIGGVQVVGARQPAIADPGGGATVDAEARNAVISLLAALRTHGLISA